MKGHAKPSLPFIPTDANLIRDRALVGGEWMPAGDEATFSVLDPATGKHLVDVANCNSKDAERAIAAAQAALPAWRARTGKERAALLRRWYDLILQHGEDLARLMTAEQGNPLAEARGEVAYGASFVEWFAEEAKRVAGETLASTWPGKRQWVLREPVGVCAAITPWNFPIAMITRKAGPALAAGCTMVIKPAEQTPLCALALAELAVRAGIPPGVLNVLTADGARSIEIGMTLCESPVVRKLSFTGSTSVGRILMRQCAPTIKKLSLELGGLAPFIVFEDADVDAAVEGAILSKYRNAGQTCVCTNRFYAQRGIYDEFVAKLAGRANTLKVGNGFDDGVQIGPLIDASAVEKVDAHVRDALALGGRVLCGGRTRAGLLYEPTVIADASAAMLIAREETFGPLAAVIAFDTEQEVVDAANDTEFGLASYFYSRNLSRALRVSEALEYGMVGINTGLISNEVAPFGGMKQSGLGREGSRHGIDEYLEMKYVCAGID
jgi:succinate-semialdehyde dehydrogenase / glutarate-semialdehyde dehydrogenase